METLLPVRPSVRVGNVFGGTSASAGASFRSHAPAPVAAPRPIFSRNFRRERSLLMASSSTSDHGTNHSTGWSDDSIHHFRLDAACESQTGHDFQRPRRLVAPT